MCLIPLINFSFLRLSYHPSDVFMALNLVAIIIVIFRLRYHHSPHYSICFTIILLIIPLASPSLFYHPVPNSSNPSFLLTIFPSFLSHESSVSMLSTLKFVNTFMKSWRGLRHLKSSVTHCISVEVPTRNFEVGHSCRVIALGSILPNFVAQSASPIRRVTENPSGFLLQITYNCQD